MTTDSISLYEVSPRDGLQSLPRAIPLRKKIKLIKKLKSAGIEDIEIGSLVHPSILPMRGSDRLYRKTGGDLLVVNARGFDRAKEIGLKRVNAVISPHTNFSYLNQNDTYENIVRMYENKCKEIPINRLYISCAFSDKTSENSVLDCIRWGKDIANYIVICDTDSSATIESIDSLCTKAREITSRLSIHLHVNENSSDYVDAAYQAGIRQFDCSVGGLGGCFSLDEAQGNLRTEALVSWALSNNIPIEENIHVDKLLSTGQYAYNLAHLYSQTRLEKVMSKIGILL